MKKLSFPIVLIVLIFCMMPISMLMVSSTSISDEVTEAIRRGSSRDLARHFGNNVDLAIPGNDGTYSKAQAELIMRNFFSDNRPVSFTINHQGSSRDGSPYVIGTYETSGNKSYRTYFLIRKVSDNYFIHQLQFELQ